MQHPADLSNPFKNILGRRIGQQLQSARQFDLSLQFRLRAERDRKMIEIRSEASSTMPFRDVGRNRNRCAPNLTHQSICFSRWKVPGRLIAGFNKLHCLLPNFEITMGFDRPSFGHRPLFPPSPPHPIPSTQYQVPSTENPIYRATLKLAPLSKPSTSASVAQLKSPGFVCLSALKALP